MEPLGTAKNKQVKRKVRYELLYLGLILTVFCLFLDQPKAAGLTHVLRRFRVLLPSFSSLYVVLKLQVVGTNYN